jgi:hypothetical protein
VREDVEEAGARGLGKQLEVAAPHRVGVAGGGPDVVLPLDVDGVVAHEVDGPDDVVEVALVEEVGGAVLGTRDEVHLDPEPQRGRADELAIGVEVVPSLSFPEGMTPDVERLAEAVDVLRASQLLHARLLGCHEVALHVLVREREALGRRIVVVGA